MMSNISSPKWQRKPCARVHVEDVPLALPICTKEKSLQ